MNSESMLQIVVTAVNEAAEQLASVVEGLAGISDQAAVTSADASASLSALGTDASAAASTAVESWDQSLADLDEMMAQADATAGEAFSGMADEAAKSGSGIESSISSVGGKLQAVGIQLGIMGAAIAAPAVEAVKAAADQVDAFDQLGNTVSNVYISATKPTAGYATEVADLTAKIDAQKGSIAEAGAAMQKWNGTTAEVGANHEKAAASVATAQINIQKLEQQLQQLTNVQSLAGGSSADTTAKFEAAARASTDLGFNVADSATALTYLFSSTQDVNETMSAYQDAMDLSAKLNIPLATAANDVVQAMNGQGRSLRDLGINVADGLAGQTALAAIQEKVAGAAQLAATQGLGPLTVAQATLNETMNDFGATVLPMLASFIEELTKVIKNVDQWAEAHPKLAEALIVFLAIVAGTLLILAPLLTLFGFLTIAVEAFNTVMALLGVTMAIGIGAALLYIGVFLGFAAVVALVIVYHKQIMDAIKDAWNWIVAFVTDHWQQIVNILFPGLGTLVAFFLNHWTQMKTDAEAFWNGLVSLVTTVVDSIEKIVGGLVSNITAAFKTISAPINAITGAVGNVASVAGTIFGNSIKAFASGGIVDSPTLALVGEAGPEAIIPLSAFNGGTSLGRGGGNGGAGSINVYIQGGSYLDSNGATTIANALARQIQLQLKLRNYF